MKHLCLGKHPCHYYVAGVCQRCGKLSRGRVLGDASPHVAKARAKDSYLETLENFAAFCRDYCLPFKPTLVSAMRYWMQEVRKKA